MSRGIPNNHGDSPWHNESPPAYHACRRPLMFVAQAAADRARSDFQPHRESRPHRARRSRSEPAHAVSRQGPRRRRSRRRPDRDLGIGAAVVHRRSAAHCRANDFGSRTACGALGAALRDRDRNPRRSPAPVADARIVLAAVPPGRHRRTKPARRSDARRRVARCQVSTLSPGGGLAQLDERDARAASGPAASVGKDGRAVRSIVRQGCRCQPVRVVADEGNPDSAVQPSRNGFSRPPR